VLPPPAARRRPERTTVPDDRWHEMSGMVMLKIETPFGHLKVARVTGEQPGTGPQDACHNWKERP